MKTTQVQNRIHYFAFAQMAWLGCCCQDRAYNTVIPPLFLSVCHPSRSCGIKVQLYFSFIAMLCYDSGLTFFLLQANFVLLELRRQSSQPAREIPQRTTMYEASQHEKAWQRHIRLTSGQSLLDNLIATKRQAMAKGPKHSRAAVRRAEHGRGHHCQVARWTAQAATPRSNNHQATLAQLRIMTASAAATAQLKTVPARRRRRRRTALSPHLAHQEKVSHNRKLDAGLVLKAHLLLCRTADFVSQDKKKVGEGI